MSYIQIYQKLIFTFSINKGNKRYFTIKVTMIFLTFHSYGKLNPDLLLWKKISMHTHWMNAGSAAFSGKLGRLCCTLQALHEQEPQEYGFQPRCYFKYAK